MHAHLTAPESLYVYKAGLVSHRGAHGRGSAGLTAQAADAALDVPNGSFGNMSHRGHLDEAGVDIQLISPRPYQMMHSESARLVEWFTAETNEATALSCQVESRFRGVAGLPQSMELDVAAWTVELRRCITELGFVGALLNPDPYEGLQQPPSLGERFWYPVYEVLCELDVPALIHSAGCRPPARESYSVHFIQEETLAVASLVQSDVFTDFPDLKLIVSHGGGAIPYQRGRWEPQAIRQGKSFREMLRTLYFDTCLYTTDSIELLVGSVGADRCLFGTEKPGVGSTRNPNTGRWVDDIHLLIDDSVALDPDEKELIFAGNAQRLFKL